MAQFGIMLSTIASLVLLSPLPLSAQSVATAPSADALPSFESVAAAVSRELAARPEYAPGDLLSRGMVEPIFVRLRQMGWIVADRKAILDRIPSDQDFLVRRLRTDKGTKFMREINRYPEAYDRLYRLAVLPDGRKTVIALIDGVGGSELLQYLTSTVGGKNLGKQLGHTPKGHDFNQPTGQIYTEQALIKRLQASYAAAKAK